MNLKTLKADFLLEIENYQKRKYFCFSPSSHKHQFYGVPKSFIRLRKKKMFVMA